MDKEIIQAGVDELVQQSVNDLEHCNNYVSRSELNGIFSKMLKKAEEKERPIDKAIKEWTTIPIDRKIAEEWVKEWVTGKGMCSLNSLETLGNEIKRALEAK